MAEQVYGDFNRFREIPILTVASYLGIPVDVTHKTRCPNKSGHKNGDKNPSVSIFPGTNSFKCWVCSDIKGDVIRFAQIWGNIHPEDWALTAELLSECARLPKPQGKLQKAFKRTRELLPQHIEGMDSLMKLTRRPEGVAAEYLKSRKIDPEIAAKAGVRYIEDTRAVARKLIELYGRDHEALQPILSEKGNLLFAYHNLLFPYIDENKHVTYIQGRDPSRKATAKELATSVTPTIPWIPGGKLGPGRVWICEGVTDALTLLSVGESVMGLPGARTWRKEWAKYLVGRDVVTCLDPDNAGIAGTEDIMQNIGDVSSIINARTPEHMDVNDLALQGRLQSFVRSI